MSENVAQLEMFHILGNRDMSGFFLNKFLKKNGAFKVYSLISFDTDTHVKSSPNVNMNISLPIKFPHAL